jgi:hypothetical protein
LEGKANHWQSSGKITPRDREAVSATYVVIPAKAGIQYSREAKSKSRGRGVLDRPVKPDDDKLSAV